MKLSEAKNRQIQRQSGQSSKNNSFMLQLFPCWMQQLPLVVEVMKRDVEFILFETDNGSLALDRAKAH